MKLFLIASLLCLSIISLAQDKSVQNLKSESQKTIKKDPTDTTLKTWKTGGFIGLNAAQGSLSNWAAGGDKFSLAINSNVGLYAFYKKNRHNWDNTLDLNLGYIKATSLGSRKNDDRIDLVSKYGYDIAPKWDLGDLFNFRSQMFKGYTYDSKGKRTFSSSFLAPAYVLISPGIGWKPNKDFSAFMSPVTARWIIVKNDSLASIGAYGVDKGKNSRAEFGAFASLNYMKELRKTFTYKSRLDLYSNYLKNPKNIDIYWTNMINMKLSKALSLTYSLDMIYDDDIKLFGTNHDSPGTQIKSMLGIGFMVKF